MKLEQFVRQHLKESVQLGDPYDHHMEAQQHLDQALAAQPGSPEQAEHLANYHMAQSKVFHTALMQGQTGLNRLAAVGDDHVEAASNCLQGHCD